MDTIMDLSKEQYKAFLLTYSSNVDYNFSSPEKDIIETQLSGDCRDMISLFNTMNEHERLQILVEGALKYLTSDAAIDEFEQALNKQFLADGKYCRFERSFFKYYSALTHAM